jgi:hypothetical protein
VNDIAGDSGAQWLVPRGAGQVAQWQHRDRARVGRDSRSTPGLPLFWERFCHRSAKGMTGAANAAILLLRAPKGQRLISMKHDPQRLRLPARAAHLPGARKQVLQSRGGAPYLTLFL